MERHGFQVKHWTYSDVDYQLVGRILYIKSIIRVASKTMDRLAFQTILPSPSSKTIYPYTHRLHNQSASQNVHTVTSNCKQHLSGNPHLQYMICIYCIILSGCGSKLDPRMLIQSEIVPIKMGSLQNDEFLYTLSHLHLLQNDGSKPAANFFHPILLNPLFIASSFKTPGFQG